MINKIAISGTEFPFRPIEELYNMAHYLGVMNLELWMPHNFQYEELDKVKKELQTRKLKAICISTWTQLNLKGDVKDRQKLIIQSIKAAKFLGASIVNTYFGANSNRTPEQAIKAYKNNIKPCLELAEKENITIVLENEFDITGNDLTRRAELILELLEKIDSQYFKLNFDPCNFYFAGEEPYPFVYKLLRKYISYVHIKDGTKYHSDMYTYPGDEFFWRDQSGDYICTDLGEGAIPYHGIFKHLKEEKYTGYITMEPHVPVAQLRGTFKRSLYFLKEKLIVL